MGLRHILAVCILIWILVRTSKDPKFGVYGFTVILFCTPSSLFWGFEEWRIPLVVSSTLLVSTFSSFKERNTEYTICSRTLLFWWISLFTLLVVSFVFSNDHQRSFDILFDKWTKTFIFCWLIILWIKEEKDIEKLFVVLIGCFTVLALRGLYRYFAGYEEIGGLAGSMMDRNDFALHLMMVLPLAYFMMEITAERSKKLLYLIMFCLIALCVAVTYSRMGFLLLLSSALLMILFSRKRLQIIIVAALIGACVLAFMPAAYFDRINTIQNYEEDASAMGRINAWKVGMQMGKDHLLSGVGLDCFELPHVYSMYANDTPHVAHNAYIQIFAEAGIFALIAWFSLIVTAIVRCIHESRQEHNSIVIKTFYKACMFSLVLYLIGSVTLSSEDRELVFIIISCVVVLNVISYRQFRLSHVRS